jgi:hypothetical protein
VTQSLFDFERRMLVVANGLQYIRRMIEPFVPPKLRATLDKSTKVQSLALGRKFDDEKSTLRSN